MTTGSLHLSDFDIDPVRGFLPSQDPLLSLGEAFDDWEGVAHGLPKLLMTSRIRSLIESLPPFPTAALRNERETRRAMGLLSYLGHAYVWGEPGVPKVLPAVLARPWAEVAAKQGRPPILSYASYALDNWYRIDEDGPIECGNICLIQNFLAGMDEEWFILIHVDIEARAAEAITSLPACLLAAVNQDAESLKSHLGKVLHSLDEMNRVMNRMPEFCDPYIYFHRVRPYIHGWKNHPEMGEGLVYEGCFEGKPQSYRGETGAQSSIVPCLDAMLGVQHADDPLKEYLLEMRTYMPPKHRAYMEAIESTGGIREFVFSAGQAELSELYDACVEGVRKFRATHLEYAASYIYKQLQTDKNNPSAVGTGGTPFMVYLKKHRDETAEHRLSSES